MLTLILNIRGSNGFQLLYGAKSFVTGLTVTGYLIYPDLTKSEVETFTELGDGIYSVTFPYSKKTKQVDERYGIVVKEDGIVKHFEVIQIID